MQLPINKTKNMGRPTQTPLHNNTEQCRYQHSDNIHILQVTPIYQFIIIVVGLYVAKGQTSNHMISAKYEANKRRKIQRIWVNNTSEVDILNVILNLRAKSHRYKRYNQFLQLDDTFIAKFFQIL